MPSPRVPALAVAALAAALLPLLPAASASLYHFFDGVADPPPNYPSGGSAVDISTVEWGAQSFRASASYLLTRVALWVEDVPPYGDSASVEIRPDAGGPSMRGPPLAAASATAQASYGWANFTFSSPLQLTSGATYWVVLRSSASRNNGWTWWNTNADGFINPGAGEISSDQGATWAAAPGDFELRTFGYVDATVAVAMASDRARVWGGDVLTQVIWFNNTGTEPARRLWINYTPAPGTTYLSDNASDIGGSRTGSYNWTFANVAWGSHYFLVRASVAAGLPSGTSLTSRVALNYTDFQGLGMRGSTATTTVVVSLPATIALAMGVDRAEARGGDALTYLLWFNNTGTEAARALWINDTLPAGVTYLWDNASDAGGARTGNYNWTFANLPPGTHHFLLRVAVPQGLAPGTQLTNGASLSYTDSQGRPRPGSVAAITTILVAPGGGETPWFLLLLIPGLGLPLLLLWPRGRVEEVFLVDYGGAMIAHLSRTAKPDKDRELVAAMLTAVQAFIRDAFATAREGELRNMDFGERRVLIRRGNYAYLAVVLRGWTPPGLRRRMAENLARVEATYGEVLAHWSGKMDAVAGADDLLSEGLLGEGHHGLLRRFLGLR